jgi:hypothetical protein
MSLYKRVFGSLVMVNDVIVTPKDEMIEEHRHLTGLLGDVIGELGTEKQKQEKELAEYKKGGLKAEIERKLVAAGVMNPGEIDKLNPYDVLKIYHDWLKGKNEKRKGQL